MKTRTWKHALLCIVAVLLAIPAVPSLVHAGTVVIEDSVNREHLALVVDRIATDSCSKMLDCRRGTSAANMSALYSSAQATNNPMPLSTFDPSNLTARHAESAGTAHYADYADSAPYALTADSANTGVSAFTASQIASTAKVDEAFYAEESPHFTYAKTAVNPGGYSAVNAYWLNSDVPENGGYYNGKQIDKLSETVLFPSRPLGKKFKSPTHATYTRTAETFYSDPTPRAWAGRTGQGSCIRDGDGVCIACADRVASPPDCKISGKFTDGTPY